MDIFDGVIEKTKKDHERYVAGNSLFAAIAEGKFEQEHYAAYLRETYHLIRHTSPLMALAAAHLPDSHRRLRTWYYEQAVDENNHDVLCINDLKALGYDGARIVQSHPKEGAWSLVTQNYYLASRNPVALLGYVLTTEGIGANYADVYADTLMEKYGFKANQVSFIRAHGGFDQKHIEDVRRAINLLEGDEEAIEQVVAVRRLSTRKYGQMFDDAMGEPSGMPVLV